MMTMPLSLSILDQSPIVAGRTPRDAVGATIALARMADQRGFARYWLAEHHAMRGLADAAPEILIARLAAETSRLRVGSGGVLLPHYSALKVAEQFRMLETLAPGRIDLGIGRAPGGTQHVAAALATRAIERFPEQVADLIDWLDGTLRAGHPFGRIVAMPSGETSPEVWLLGSSDYSAALAAELGLPFAFAHFISGDAPEITRSYRTAFKPSARTSEPRVLLALSALAAATNDEAQEQAKTIELWRLRIRRGIDLPVPSLDEARAHPYTLGDRAEIAHARKRLVAGEPAAVRERIETLVHDHGADEAMIVTIAAEYATRRTSYELIADAFALAAVAA